MTLKYKVINIIIKTIILKGGIFTVLVNIECMQNEKRDLIILQSSKANKILLEHLYENKTLKDNYNIKLVTDKISDIEKNIDDNKNTLVVMSYVIKELYYHTSIEYIKEVQKENKYKKTRFVILTVENLDKEKYKELNILDCIKKPILEDQLVNKLVNMKWK